MPGWPSFYMPVCPLIGQMVRVILKQLSKNPKQEVFSKRSFKFIFDKCVHLLSDFFFILFIIKRSEKIVVHVSMFCVISLKKIIVLSNKLSWRVVILSAFFL
jgi:hypothetical protein